MATVSQWFGGFWPFYRRYAKTGVHAVTTAALTGLGLLTFVNKWFAALAVAAYVVPPVYLYVREGGPEGAVEAADAASKGDPNRQAEGPSGDGPGSATNDSPAAVEDGVAVRGDVADDDVAGRDADDAPGRREGDEGPTDREDESERGESDGSDDTAPRTDETHPLAGGEAGPWSRVDAPTEGSLRAVVAAGTRAYVAGEGGAVLAREAGGWRTLLESGPAAAGNALRGVDVTAGGERVWVAGDSGALGRVDPESGRHVDHSAPQDRTDTWNDVAAAGPAGEETLLLVNGSGEVLRGTVDGDDVDWDDPVKPGSGSSLSRVRLVDPDLGFCCDTNGGVFRTAGGSFERIGVDDAGALTGLAAAGRHLHAVDADGFVHRYDGSTWTRIRGADAALNGVDVGRGATGGGAGDGDASDDATGSEPALACGDGGVVCRARDGGWEREESPVETDLRDVAVGDDGRAVAVGDDGTVLERTSDGESKSDGAARTDDSERGKRGDAQGE